MPDFSNEQIQLFISLFKGRQDVFAIRWESNEKSGYIPAYDLDREEYARHKANGGTLKNFPNKKYSGLTEQRILNHLSGKETIGTYPLLTDNSSWFIVADFDESISMKRSWTDDCRLLMKKCEEHNIPAYLERSRSGNGGHVWIFFDRNYPAIKSRRIMLTLLEHAAIISTLDKNSNYDRLLPNQDHHSGKGLGNLIALPLQKQPLENNNSCFIDPETLQNYPDQLDFLRTIKRVSVAHLDEIYNRLTGTQSSTQNTNESSQDGAIEIKLSNQITIAKHKLTVELTNFLRDNLNFVNADYIIKKKLGKNTFGIEPYFKTLIEKDDKVFLPRGFIGKLLRFCKDQKVKYNFIDERKKLPEVNFSFKASLYEHQEMALDAAEKKEMGVIVAPPGSGKTIVGLAIIAEKKQPALIIVHRKQLFDQWVERIQSFLGIAGAHIGKIIQGNQKIGTHVTVAMIQSLAAIPQNDSLLSAFGTIIVDECHHVPSKTFRNIITQLSSYYLYGLTATPIRKNNDERLIFTHIGDIVYEIKNTNTDQNKKLSIIIRETDLMIPFDYKTDDAETLYKVLIHDTNRNRLITEDIIAEITTGKKVLVLTERKAHIEVLQQYLKNKYEVISVSGDDSSNAQKIKFKQIADGHFQTLITTGQFLGEGTDIDNIQCLVLAYPFSFEGKLVQYIGRVQRSEITPIIYDYRDIHIDFLENQFRQRNKYYRQLMQAGQLQKNEQLLLIFDGDMVMLNNADHVLPITCLDIEVEVERFKEDIAWLLRVLSYNEETGVLMTEILSYAARPQPIVTVQKELQFLIIEKIKFRSLDTGYLLRSVELKKNPLPATSKAVIPLPVYEEPETPTPPKPIAPTPPPKPVEYTLQKTIKVQFDKLQFKNTCVSFSIFIDELNQEVNFEIENPDIHEEFEAIKEYFSKILKKKSITAQCEIRYREKEILSSSASSEDIARINSSVIENVRFDFVKRRIINFNSKAGDPVVNTIESLLQETKDTGKEFFKSEQELIDNILSVKDSKHYHQLTYLSSKHLSQVLKLRFVLQPFSFLFLLAGDTKYHLIWETLNSEEATYIWHFDKTMNALRAGLKEVDAILNEIKTTGKQDYLKKEHDNFSRVMHDYSDIKNGFISWKDSLEEKVR